ncbi:MAG: hypothetical protein LBO72_07980 [Helicobacteraceae bacterium]|jgi:hypothetical protein|nr:hypothetical protein [Helicobacteraceae bacterium]
MQAHADLDEQRATVEAFFLSQSTFENELFAIDDASELHIAMRETAKKVLERPVALATVNFMKLQSYAQFRIEGCVLALKEHINQEVEYLIREEAGFDSVIAQEVRADQKKQAFILNQAKRYFIAYRSLFNEAIADTFFARVLAALDMNLVDRVVQEVIDGAGAYTPVLTSASGAPLVSKSHQIWMRLKQARLTKDKEIKTAKDNIDRLFKKIEGIEKNIAAINEARSLTLERVQTMTLDELKEIVINEDGSRSELKRVFQYVPAGEAAFWLAEQMDRGRRAGRNDIQKSEYKRAATFFENCNINNTPKELANKAAMMLEELPKLKDTLAAAIKKEEALQERGLHTFDDALEKMRDAFIKNIGRTRL